MALFAASRSFGVMSRVKWKHAVPATSLFFVSSKHTSTKNATQANHYADVQFSVFYRFPFITTVRLLSRLKIYQTAVSVLLAPAMTYCYQIGAIELPLCIGAFSISTFALVMLYIISNFCQRVIGLAALSGDRKLVRLSHLTFFGGRNDLVVPVEDVVPFSDIGEDYTKMFVTVRRYSTADKLYMSLVYGRAENIEAFQQVFGVIS